MNYIFNKKDFTISQNGISEIKAIQIGGIKQYLLIQSENSNLPVLLVIHGGPSMPIPGVSSRGQDYALITCTKELVKHFTLVFWDQRGTGKTYSKDTPKESMNVQQFIRDANEVTDYLRSRFNQEKIHVAGHSWGSMIGLPLAYQNPDKFHSYIGFSQFTNWIENDKLCYKWLLHNANARNDKKALNELVAIGEPPFQNVDHWSLMRKWLFTYKSMVYDAGDKGSGTFLNAFKIMLKSADYSLRDVFNSLIRGFRLSYTEQMVKDMNDFDLFTHITKLEVPVIFIHGAHETHVWPELIQRYYDTLHAPFKKLYWMKKSGHAFHVDDAKEIEQLLITHLRNIDCPQ